MSHDEDESDTQVRLLDRAGGESQKLTDVKGSVSDYAWSPDGKRPVLAVDDPDPSELAEERGQARHEAADRSTAPLQAG